MSFGIIYYTTPRVSESNMQGSESFSAAEALTTGVSLSEVSTRNSVSFVCEVVVRFCALVVVSSDFMDEFSEFLEELVFVVVGSMRDAVVDSTVVVVVGLAEVVGEAAVDEVVVVALVVVVVVVVVVEVVVVVDVVVVVVVVVEVVVEVVLEVAAGVLADGEAAL